MQTYNFTLILVYTKNTAAAFLQGLLFIGVDTTQTCFLSRLLLYSELMLFPFKNLLCLIQIRIYLQAKNFLYSNNYLLFTNLPSSTCKVYISNKKEYFLRFKICWIFISPFLHFYSQYNYKKEEG